MPWAFVLTTCDASKKILDLKILDLKILDLKIQRLMDSATEQETQVYGSRNHRPPAVQKLHEQEVGDRQSQGNRTRYHCDNFRPFRFRRLHGFCPVLLKFIAYRPP